MPSRTKSKSKSKSKGSRQGASVSVRCHLNFLEGVSERLSLANMHLMRRSCFGHLFDIGEMQFQGQLYHILLRNHLLTDNESRMRFLFHDTVHEFGPVEFALITGLKFSGFYEPPQSSIVHSTCFTDMQSLRFQDIEDAFYAECKRSKGESELALKLAMLYVLYAVVLMRDKKDKNIEMQYVHLVDDLEKFDKYPWGRVSYEYLVENTLSRKAIVDKKLQEGSKCAYDAFGFVLALQVWAYEAIPELGEHCATILEGNELLFPRMLRWTACEFFRYDDLIQYFPTGQAGEIRGLVGPSEDEWTRLHALGLHERHMSPSRIFLKPGATSSKRKGVEQSGDESRGKKKLNQKQSQSSSPLRRSARNLKNPQPEMSAESKSPPPMSGVRGRVEEDTCSNFTLNEVGAYVKELIVKFSAMESLIRGLKCFPNTEELLTPEEELLFRHGEDDGSPKPKEAPGKPSVRRSPVKAAVTGSVKRPVGRPPKKTPARSVKKSPMSSVKKESAEQSNVAKGSARRIPSTGKSVARNLFTPNPSFYDPTVASFIVSDVKPFQAWYGTGKSTGFEDETTLPIMSKTHVKREWFHDLYERRKWLGDEHIDALTNLLIWKYNRAKDRFASGWTLMESLGTGYLIKGALQEVNGTLGSYVHGIFPREGGLPWSVAKKVIGIANVGFHWVCYAIELDEQRIVIYDSNSESSDWERVSGIFSQMATFVPLICRMTGVWDKKKRNGALKVVWPVEQFQHPPQQSNGFDCGIMALKFMECLVSGFDMEHLDPSRGGIWRWAYCQELFDLGRKFPRDV